MQNTFITKKILGLKQMILKGFLLKALQENKTNLSFVVFVKQKWNKI